jgi:predicted unusual protein kinase regulating ubiquinone biosynthesis (AarF/ABC1/UbiB family)
MGDPNPVVPSGRLRRTAPLAGLAAQTATGAVIDILRRRLRGQRGTSAEFHVRSAERYTEFLSRSKGVLMKAGQILSFVDTAGLVPDEYQQVYQSAMSGLRADAEPMDYELVAAVIEADLGRPPEELFAYFEPSPLAAASIGQVHAALLPDGTEVAVKVQYPGVAEAIRDDLDNTELLSTALKLASGMVPGLTNLDLRSVADEISARIGEELDYTTELVNQADFADRYRDHPFIRVPEVFAQMSSPHVLTMQLVQGARWEAAVEASQPIRNRWGEVIDRFFYGTIARFGMFNADPHPGNYLFHDDGTVTFLDFGCVKRFSPSATQAFSDISHAVVDGNEAELRRSFVSMGFLSADDGLSGKEIMEWYRPTFEPILAPQPFTYTSEFAAATVRRLFDPFGPGSAVNRRFDVPSDYVFVNRIYIGMNSVMGALRATADWRAIYEEHRTGVAATELGELEMQYFGERSWR